MAEGVGFEPTEAFVSQVFRTSALNRSAIPPYGSHGWNRTNLPRLTAPTNKFVGFQVGSPQGYYGAIASRLSEESGYAGDHLPWNLSPQEMHPPH